MISRNAQSIKQLYCCGFHIFYKIMKADLFVYLFSDFHLEKKKKRALNERLTNPLEVPARPAPLTQVRIFWMVGGI